MEVKRYACNIDVLWNFYMDKMIHGKPLLPRAVYVEALPDYMLKIKFNNNEEKYFDVKKYMIYHAINRCKIKNFLKQFI